MRPDGGSSPGHGARSMARMDSSPPDDAAPSAPRRSRGFGRVLLSAIVSSVVLAGVLWAVSRYVFKWRDDYRLYVWVAIGGVVSRLLTWPLLGRRIPGLVVEVLSIALFAIVAYGGYVYVWPSVPLRFQ